MLVLVLRLMLAMVLMLTMKNVKTTTRKRQKELCYERTICTDQQRFAYSQRKTVQRNQLDFYATLRPSVVMMMMMMMIGLDWDSCHFAL